MLSLARKFGISLAYSYFEALPLRYLRSENKIKASFILIFSRLSVSLSLHLVPEGCETQGLRWECSGNLQHYPML